MKMTNELKKEINTLKNDITNIDSYYLCERLFELLEYYYPVISDNDVREVSKICVKFVEQANLYHKMAFIGKLNNQYMKYHYSCNAIYHIPMITLNNIMTDILDSVKETD